MTYDVTIVRNVSGKLADVMLRFEPGEPLAGFSLGGFQVWAPRDGSDRPTVTFPARQWAIPGGGTGSVVLLRDGRKDKYLDPPETVAFKAELVAAYEREVQAPASRRAGRPRLVARGGAVPAAAPAVAAAPRLRHRRAAPVGTLTHRVADSHAP